MITLYQVEHTKPLIRIPTTEGRGERERDSVLLCYIKDNNPQTWNPEGIKEGREGY